MTRYQWDGSFKSFAHHLDPDKEEQLKWTKTETENEVKRVLKLNKNINHSNNKEKNNRIKSETIHLIEDFQKQYDSIYSLYEDLRDKVKNNLSDGDYDDDHYYTYSSDSDYHSPAEAKPEKTKTKNKVPKVPKRNRIPKAEEESSDIEGMILKDKLTASTEVKKSTNVDLQTAGTPDFGEIIKVVRIQGEDEIEKMNRNLEQIKDLEGQVASLKADISTISKEKTQLKEKVSKLEAEISKLDITCKDNESKKKQYEDNEQQNLSRISDLTTKADNMQIELNTLKIQKSELEVKLSGETEKWSSEVTSLKEQLMSLQNEFVSVNNQKAELESEIRTKSEETSDCLLRIEALRNELTLNVKRTSEEKSELEQKIQSLCIRRSELEEELKVTNYEASQLHAEKQKLQAKISALQTSLDAKESELLTEQNKVKVSENRLAMQNTSLAEEIKNLNKKLENMEKELQAAQLQLEKEKDKSSLSKSEMVAENAELTNKIAHQKTSLVDLEGVVKKLKEENEKSQSELQCSKSSLHLVERKVEEIASGFRKEFEDKYRILSRRIKVAEQQQADTEEWCINAKETCIKENKDLKAKAAKTEMGFKNIKDIALTANDVVSSLDSVALKFEECTDHFLNRISKSSCELKFAKNWATRKNRALFHVREEVDLLLQQLDDKEKETLVFREKVWKSENKVRELEKKLKEKEDAMLGFEEEKREAIRQLCVGIDYHRSRSDFYKKAMSDTSSGRRIAS